MSQGVSKVCTVCNTDCSNRKRLRKPDGSYICADCVASQNLTGGKPRLAADSAPIALDRSTITAIPENRATQCPTCARIMPPEAEICVGCGFDKRKGVQSTAVDPVKRKKQTTCKKCGYDLTGLRSNICPECGKRFSRESWREWNREMGRRVVFMSYAVPIGMLVVGAGSVCLALIGLRKVEFVPSYLSALGCGIVASTIAYIMMCMTYLGWGAPVHLIAMRMAGVLAVMDAIKIMLFIMLGGTGVIIFSPIHGLITFVIYLGLLKWIMDLEEIGEAFLLAILTSVTYIAVRSSMFNTI